MKRSARCIPRPVTGAALAAGLGLLALAAQPAAARSINSLRAAIVKIYVTVQRDDYTLPWQAGRMGSGTGTGFIIAGKRIMTNAHVVSDAKFLHIQKDGDARRFNATVAFVAHDCDLAILAVTDPAFFEKTTAVTFARELPALNDEVTVMGYPMGGDRISLTKGVVSRIDYSAYSHSGVDQHLVLQVDAAINPGNSGGPVLLGANVVGVAFQGLTAGDNIGYVIPIPVVRHFLEDIADGTYHNYPELGVAALETRNDALRGDLQIPAGKSGVVVYYTDPFGSAHNRLLPRDVLLSVDGHPIAADGNVTLDGNNVEFAELLERKQWGDSAVFDVWRSNALLRISMPLANPRDPFALRNVYDERPRYYINGGLVFSPLNREVLRNISPEDPNHNQVLYHSRCAKTDNLIANRKEFILLLRRLPHEVNTYAEGFIHGVVTEVNGKAIGELEDVKTAMRTPVNGFHLIRFAGMEDVLVLDARATAAANPDILDAYGIPAPEYLEKQP